MIELRPLRFMHRHRPGGIVLRQTTWLNRLDAAIGHREPDAQAIASFQRNTDIAVKQPQRAVVAGDHHRPSFIPARMARQSNRPLAVQHLLQLFVHAANAIRTIAQRAEQLKLAKGGNQLCGLGPFTQQLQKTAVTCLRLNEHRFILLGGAQRMQGDIVERLTQRLPDRAAFTAVHRPGQMTDTGVAAKTVAFL